MRTIFELVPISPEETKAACIPKDAEEIISQLESLHRHCMGMINREEEGEAWEADCRALKAAIEAIKQQDTKATGEPAKKRIIKTYLSGPITGTDDYIERFAEAENKLTAQGYRVINPAKMLASLPEGFAHEDYMTICMGLLTACNAICMLDGWETSPGANREYGYALARGMQTISLNSPKEAWAKDKTAM